jgi:hypothetical protein
VMLFFDFYRIKRDTPELRFVFSNTRGCLCDGWSAAPKVDHSRPGGGIVLFESERPFKPLGRSTHARVFPVQMWEVIRG